MCPFMGLTYKDDDGNVFSQGDGLTLDEMNRLSSYFGKFNGYPFNHGKANELAQFALDNKPIPDDWTPKKEPDDKLSASEAVFGLFGWLTTREKSVTFGAKHDASIAAELAGKFCNANDLNEPRKHWNDNLKHPEE